MGWVREGFGGVGCRSEQGRDGGRRAWGGKDGGDEVVKKNRKLYRKIGRWRKKIEKGDDLEGDSGKGWY